VAQRTSGCCQDWARTGASLPSLMTGWMATTTSTQLAAQRPEVVFSQLVLHPGVDVMITIFYDFRLFSAKKWSFSWKPMLWCKFCKKNPKAVFCKKVQFLPHFLAKIFLKSCHRSRSTNISKACIFHGSKTCLKTALWRLGLMVSSPLAELWVVRSNPART
jgi:hypothetical protein